MGSRHDQHLLLFLLCLEMTNTEPFAHEDDSQRSRSAYVATNANKETKGHVVKRFESPSLLSCSHVCMRNEWCTSTNFKLFSKTDGKGICELLNAFSFIDGTEFHEEKGVTFAILLKDACQTNPCQNNGDCLPDFVSNTYHCVCKAGFAGRHCEEAVSGSTQSVSASQNTSQTKSPSLSSTSASANVSMSVSATEPTSHSATASLTQNVSVYLSKSTSVSQSESQSHSSTPSLSTSSSAIATSTSKNGSLSTTPWKSASSSTSQNISASKSSFSCPSGSAGLYADPSDCSKYIKCHYGQETKESCPQGNLFNPKTKQCDWPHNVDCP